MSKRLYVPVDALFGTSKAARRVGRDGWLVFQQVLALHRVNPAEGWVSASQADPESVALGLAAFGFTDDEARDALDRCVDAGLIERDDRGAVFIPNWEQWLGPKSSTERSRERRKRINVQRDATDATQCNADATRDVAPVARNGGNDSPSLPLPSLPQDSQGVKKGTVQSPPDELRSDSPDLKSARGIAAILGSVKWSNGPKQRGAESRRLAGLGFSPEDIQETWIYAAERGQEPLRLFAAILKEPSRINDAVAARRKQGASEGPRNGPAEDPRHVGALLRRVVG